MFSKPIIVGSTRKEDFSAKFNKKLNEITTKVGKEPICVIPVISHYLDFGELSFEGLVLFPGLEQ